MILRIDVVLQAGAGAYQQREGLCGAVGGARRLPAHAPQHAYQQTGQQQEHQFRGSHMTSDGSSVTDDALVAACSDRRCAHAFCKGTTGWDLKHVYHTVQCCHDCYSTLRNDLAEHMEHCRGRTSTTNIVLQGLHEHTTVQLKCSQTCGSAIGRQFTEWSRPPAAAGRRSAAPPCCWRSGGWISRFRCAFARQNTQCASASAQITMHHCGPSFAVLHRTR